MLWRLNHELLPDPGRPTARMTAPFGGRDGRGCSDGNGRGDRTHLQRRPVRRGAGLDFCVRDLHGRDGGAGGGTAGGRGAAEDSLDGAAESVSAAGWRGSGVGSGVALAAGRGRRIFRRRGIVERGLQRGGLSGRLFRRFFTPFQLVLHPFTHVGLLTYPDARGQLPPTITGSNRGGRFRVPTEPKC